MNIAPGASLSCARRTSSGVGLFVFAFVSARRHHHELAIEGLGPVRRLLTMGRAGLGVMRAPAGADDAAAA